LEQSYVQLDAAPGANWENHSLFLIFSFINLYVIQFTSAHYHQQYSSLAVTDL